jgi:hypothetical protein
VLVDDFGGHFAFRETGSEEADQVCEHVVGNVLGSPDTRHFFGRFNGHVLLEEAGHWKPCRSGQLLLNLMEEIQGEMIGLHHDTLKAAGEALIGDVGDEAFRGDVDVCTLHFPIGLRRVPTVRDEVCIGGRDDEESVRAGKTASPPDVRKRADEGGVCLAGNYAGAYGAESIQHGRWPPAGGKKSARRKRVPPGGFLFMVSQNRKSSGDHPIETGKILDCSTFCPIYQTRVL